MPYAFNTQPLPRLPNGIYFSVYSIGVKWPIIFNRGTQNNEQFIDAFRKIWEKLIWALNIKKIEA